MNIISFSNNSRNSGRFTKEDTERAKIFIISSLRVVSPVVKFSPALIFPDVLVPDFGMFFDKFVEHFDAFA